MDSVVGSGVEVVDSVVGAGTGVIKIVGLVAELEAELVVLLVLLGVEEVDLLKTGDVAVVGAAVTVCVFFEDDGSGAALDVSFAGGAEGAALLVVGS